MALGSLPPWLQINPREYLLATQAGVQAGHAIAESARLAFEEQQKMQMAAEHQKAQLAQQAIENAAQRLAAERLENYRQQEVAARNAQLGIENKRLGSLDIQQQRADEMARHNQAMEEARLNARPEAGITTLPDAPGFTFLRNPSGALTPLVRPPHVQSPLERARLQMSGINAMAPRGGEDPTSADYQSRTNAIGGILRSLSAPLSNLPVKPTKRMVYNPKTKKVETIEPDQTDEEDDQE